MIGTDQTTSPLMNTGVAFSRGYGRADNTPEQRTAASFAELADWIDWDRAQEKGQQWIAGPCRPAPDDDFHRVEKSTALAIARPHRCSRCALPRGWVGMDVDGPTADGRALSPESFAALVAHLQRYSGIVYTTPSHTQDAPRCRIILELDSALVRDELIAATRRIREQIDAALTEQGYAALPWDDSCDRPEQPLYLPTTMSKLYRLEGQAVATHHDPVMAEPRTDGSTAAMPIATRTDTYALAALDAAVRAVLVAQRGERNEVLNREAYSLGGFVGQGRLARQLAEAGLIEAITSAAWDEPEKSAATIRSGLSKGAAAPRIDGLDDAIRMAPLASAEADDRLIVVNMDRLRTATPTLPTFVLEPLIPRGTLTLFGGHGGSGKSQLALIWAAHVACGCAWGHFPATAPQRVLFASLEDPGDLVLARLCAVAETYGLDRALIEKNLLIVDGADKDAVLVTEVMEFGNRRLRPTPRLDEVTELAHGAGLIVIDNASDTYDGDENNRRQVRYFVRKLTQLARANDAGLLLLAHIDKNAALHGARGNSYSGSTAWHNSARSRLAILVEDGQPVLLHEKANLSATAAPTFLTWQDTSFGIRLLVPSHPPSPADEAAQIEADAATLLGLMATAEREGIQMPAAARGPSTTAQALRDLKELPAAYRTKSGAKRIARAVTELLRSRMVTKVEVRSSSRNARELLKLTPEGNKAVGTWRSSNPHTPSETDARAGERVSDNVSDPRKETDATHAPSTFVFSPAGPGVLYAALDGLVVH